MLVAIEIRYEFLEQSHYLVLESIRPSTDKFFRKILSPVPWTWIAKAKVQLLMECIINVAKSFVVL